MNPRLLVFGREPIPSRVKTRLAADIGDSAAARVYEVLLRNTLEKAAASRADVELWLADPLSSGFQTTLRVPVAVQQGANIGERMADAFERSFEGGAERVVLIGTDCPHIEVRHIVEAAVALDDHAVVLGPAEDGGYWLVAQRAPGVDLFSNVPWSHEETLTATRARLEELSVGWSELEMLNDLDTEEDLKALLADPRTPNDLVQQLHAATRSLED